MEVPPLSQAPANPTPPASPSSPAASGAAMYEVARPRGQCVVCQTIIPPQQPLMAALKETAIGFERLDVCLNDWPGFDKTGLVGFWKTTMPLVEQKKKLTSSVSANGNLSLCDLELALPSIVESRRKQL